MVVSRFLSLLIFGFESGCLGLEKHLAGEVLQKSTFAEVGFLMIIGAIFHNFGGIVATFHGFCCLGDWLGN